MRCSRGHWHGRLRGCGYRITSGREIILDLLTKAKGHLSAEEIYLKVHGSHPSIGLTSVYRTLELLTNMGMVQKFDFGDKRARYEITNSENGKNRHHHLVCTECKRVTDCDDLMEEETELFQKTQNELAKKYNFEIKSRLVQFYGLCRKCKDKKTQI